MSCFDVIDTKKMGSEKLANGAEIIRHDEMAFTNHFTDGKSFDDVSEKPVDNDIETGIHFAVDFKLHPDGVSKMKTLGNQIQSNTCVLQHNLVMYSFAYAINVVGEDEESGLMCKFRLIPVSQTFRYPTGMTKGGTAISYKPEVPDLLDAKLMLGNAQSLDLVKEENGSFGCETLITVESLKNITLKGIATLRVEMTVDSGYFDIGQYVDLNLREAYVVANSHKILEKILQGEEVPKSDWVITVGDGSPRDFHVHAPVLANASFTLKAAIQSHMSIGNGALAMVSHENRFILGNLKSEDMRLILTFIYQRRFLLPEFDAVGRIGSVLSLLFKDDVLEFFKYWEADIIKKLMALDRSEGVSTVAECVKALIRVSSAPQGALLAAYNTAIIVAADAWQMIEGKGKKLKTEKVKKAIGKDWGLIDDLMEVIGDFKVSVCGVTKSKFVH